MTNVLPARTKAAFNARVLMARNSSYIVPTTILVAFLASQIVREQSKRYVRESVEWALAMYDVAPVAGGRPVKSASGVAIDVEDRVRMLVGNGSIDMHTAVEAIQPVLPTVYGRQLRVTGWLPGHRIADGRTVLELSGNACPNCTSNPTGYKVGDAKTARCLNSEDCGWTSN